MSNQDKAIEALVNSNRIIKNTVNIIYKTTHAGKDVHLVNEAVIFLSKLHEQNEKLLANLEEEKLKSGSEEENA